MGLRILIGAPMAALMSCAPSLQVGAYVGNWDGLLRDGCGTAKHSSTPGSPYVVTSTAASFALWFESYPSFSLTKTECQLDGPHFSCDSVDPDSESLYLGTVRSKTDLTLFWTQHFTGPIGRDHDKELATCSDTMLYEFEWESSLPEYLVDIIEREDG